MQACNTPAEPRRRQDIDARFEDMRYDGLVEGGQAKANLRGIGPRDCMDRKNTAPTSAGTWAFEAVP